MEIFLTGLPRLSLKMYSWIFLTGIIYVGVPLLNIPYSVDACSLWPTPDVCQNVSCPNGDTCREYRVTWCQDRVMDTCDPPLPVCGDKGDFDPCAVNPCPNGTVCFSVKDQCKDNGACTIKAQCEALNRPGTCPPPRPVFMGDCSNFCENDAKCPSGMKCCPAESNFGEANVCS